jgi:hypothetical protein
MRNLRILVSVETAPMTIVETDRFLKDAKALSGSSGGRCQGGEGAAAHE